MAPTTAAAMSSVPIDQAGVGSAVINSMRQVGGSLGVAVMGTLMATQLHVGPGDPRYATEFVDGYHRALLVGAAVLFAGALLAVATVGRERAERHPAVERELAHSATLEEAA